jgi:predicted TIM-barrel fold metal-dependent hydrolase
MATQVAKDTITLSPTEVPVSRLSRRRAFPIVDVDVHHTYADKADLLPYMSRVDGERFSFYGMGVMGNSYASNGGWRGRRADTVDIDEPQPDSLSSSAVDADDTRIRLLDASGIDLALLTGGPASSASAMMDVDYANAICRAFNDYSLEHWVAKDDRFRLALHINSQDPQGAAAEIDRLGSHPAVCAISVGCGAPRPFGHRFYHPIYEACERNGLAVAMHFGSEGGGINPAPSPAGFPSYYIESRQLRPSFYAVHVASFIFEGVFIKFPSLKVAMIEGGFAWVPPMMWKMDLDWKGLRHQTPWVEKLPSEYLKDHIRFSTQPMEEPADPDALELLVKWMAGERTLMFATDYPHWDWDDPAQAFVGFPDDMRRRIFAENAIETFNFIMPAGRDGHVD